MKKLNKIISYTSALLLFVVMISSCKKKFLDREPYGGLPTNESIKTVDDMEIAVNGAYANLRSANLYGRTIPLFGDLAADNALRARPVIHDPVLTRAFGKPGRDDPRHPVGRAPRWIRVDHPYLLCGVGLPPGLDWNQRQNHSENPRHRVNGIINHKASSLIPARFNYNFGNRECQSVSC